MRVFEKKKMMQYEGQSDSDAIIISGSLTQPPACVGRRRFLQEERGGGGGGFTSLLAGEAAAADGCGKGSCKGSKAASRHLLDAASNSSNSPGQVLLYTAPAPVYSP
jgi:hypothetical protein